jgi:hypothetical protein
MNIRTGHLKQGELVFADLSTTDELHSTLRTWSVATVSSEGHRM